MACIIYKTNRVIFPFIIIIINDAKKFTIRLNICNQNHFETTIDYLSQLFETNGIAHQIQDDESLTIDIADDRNRSFQAAVAVMDYGNAVGFSSTPFEFRQTDPKTYELVKSVLLGINFQNNSNIYCGLNDQTRSIKVFTKIPLIGWSMLQADDLKNIFFEYLEFIEGVGDIF